MCVCAWTAQDSRDTLRGTADKYCHGLYVTWHLSIVRVEHGIHLIIIKLYTQHASFLSCPLFLFLNSLSIFLKTHTHTHTHTFNNLWYPVAQLLCRNLTFECVWARERVCVCVYWTKEEALTITAHWLPILPAFSLTELKWIDTISAGVESGTAKTKETRSSNLEVADTVRTVITTLPKTQAPAALLLHSLSNANLGILARTSVHNVAVLWIYGSVYTRGDCFVKDMCTHQLGSRWLREERKQKKVRAKGRYPFQLYVLNERGD